LSLLHNIWTKEHNLVCDMFKARFVYIRHLFGRN
jgi:hypothetical protein